MFESEFVYNNWGGFIKAKPSIKFTPNTIEQLQKFVVESYPSKIKAFGSCHSPSDLPVSNSIMIDIRHLNRFLQLKNHLSVKNRSDNLPKATVEAGITLKDLVLELQKRGFALPILGSISEQTLAGAISTATHGGSAQIGTLSSLVHGIEIMDAKGIIHNCKSGDKLFGAAVCSLGFLGIITKIEISVYPLYNLKVKEFTVSFHDFISKAFEKTFSTQEYSKFHWIPHTDCVLVWEANKTFAKTTTNVNSMSGAMKGFILFHLFHLLIFISILFPTKLTKFINNLHVFLNYNSKITNKIIFYKDAFNIDCLYKQHVVEWSVPRERALEALIELNTAIQSLNLVVHFPIEVRPVGSDPTGILLSPTSGRESVYVGIVSYRAFGYDFPGREHLFKCFSEIMLKSSGRPHWAKTHSCTKSDLIALYGIERINSFVEICREMDPSGRFTNDYFIRHFK